MSGFLAGCSIAWASKLMAASLLRLYNLQHVEGDGRFRVVIQPEMQRFDLLRIELPAVSLETAHRESNRLQHRLGEIRTGMCDVVRPAVVRTRDAANVIGVRPRQVPCGVLQSDGESGSRSGHRGAVAHFRGSYPDFRFRSIGGL